MMIATPLEGKRCKTQRPEAQLGQDCPCGDPRCWVTSYRSDGRWHSSFGNDIVEIVRGANVTVEWNAGIASGSIRAFGHSRTRRSPDEQDVRGID